MQSSLRRYWSTLEARLEDLSPFWTVFALTLVETVGEGVLAIPIAVAQIGPVAGIIILIILGLVNVLTIAAIAEASARNGSVRYGEAYIGRVVQDYLGTHGSLILGVGVAIVQFQALLSYMVGFSTTLEASTHFPAEIWECLIFALCFYFVWRGSFDSTVALALMIGLVNISIILILSLMTLPHVHWSNFALPDLADGAGFDLHILNIVFGVIFSAYLGHLGVSNSAQVALRRDTSARSLVWGSMAAQATLMGLYCLWVFAVNGAISHDVLAQQSSTALVPLAAELGPVVNWLGAGLIVLGIGMSSIVTALGLFWLVREVLPTAAPALNDATVLERIWSQVFSSRGRFWLAASPILFLFGLVEWQLRNQQESFTEPLSFLGVIAAPLLAGLFPVLLLLSSRRKGERSITSSIQFLGKPLVAFSLYGLFLLNLFVHGLIIWQRPVEQAVALLMGVIMLISPGVFLLRGAFTSRMVVELRQEAQQAIYSVIVNGQPASALIHLEQSGLTAQFDSYEGTVPSLNALSQIEFDLSRHQARELKVWVHRITADHNSEPLSATLEVFNGQEKQTLELGGKAHLILPLQGRNCHLKLIKFGHLSRVT